MTESEVASTICSFFVIVWIISWFAGIWVYHLQLFLTGVFALFLAIGYYPWNK